MPPYRESIELDEEKGDGNREASKALLEEDDDEEGLPYEPQLPAKPHQQPEGASYRLWICIVVNTLSTVAIVFVNKSIFTADSQSSLRHAQVAFAAFHFFITALLLYVLSRPFINVFQAKRVEIVRILPLSFAMILNVVLQNAALANSSIQFNQVARVLLTPACAALNLVFYRKTLSWTATLTLIPICVGVAVVSYFDTNSSGAAKAKDTTPLGVMFALAGVCASAVYTVWIKPFHEKLGCDSWQLLLNQAAVSVGLMLYVIPLIDDTSVWRKLEVPTWCLIGLSGILAAAINISMFVIIAEAGAVSSTVVGHLKTCSIILLGWIVSQKSLKDASLFGFLLAIGGIISYSYVTLKPSK